MGRMGPSIQVGAPGIELSPKRKLECLPGQDTETSQTLRHLSAVLGAAGPLEVSGACGCGSSGRRDGEGEGRKPGRGAPPSAGVGEEEA